MQKGVPSYYVNPLKIPIDSLCCTSFDDGPRNFEPWSSDVDEPELAPLSPHHTNGVSSPTGLTCIAALHGGSLVYWARTRDKANHDPIPIPLGAKFSNKKLFIKYLLR
ncbi:hypothetical protein TNCV_4569281 [Trichonephila clavipes]|nr:hypothetical protein TNCV_4569281 [Trichonephila clavipes]